METVFVATARTGKGLYAAKPFKRGEKITLCKGRKLTYKQVSRMKKHANALQVGPESYIDFEEPGVYSNHSCNPNAGIRPDRWMVAIKNIKKGQEITWDYSTTISLDTIWRMKCKCHSKNCRKYISNYGTIPEATKKKYTKLNIVQKYLR